MLLLTYWAPYHRQSKSIPVTEILKHIIYMGNVQHLARYYKLNLIIAGMIDCGDILLNLSDGTNVFLIPLGRNTPDWKLSQAA